MSNEKIKSENYTQFGGINSKISPYLNVSGELLDLINLDGQSPGALSQRWGSTYYIGQTMPGRINTLIEFNKLDGSSYLVFGHSGGLWSGATTGNHQGLSMTYLAAGFSGYISIPYAFWKAANGAMIAGWESFRYNGDPRERYLSTNVSISIDPYQNGKNKISSVVFQDWLLMADGQKFIKYNGISTYAVGLPPALTYGVTNLGSDSTGAWPGVGTSTGMYLFWASYVNNRGFEGPIWPCGVIEAKGSLPSASLINMSVYMYTPEMYGISAVKIYSHFDSATMLGYHETRWNLSQHYLSTEALENSTAYNPIKIGTDVSGLSALHANIGAAPPVRRNPLGTTLVIGASGYYYEQLAFTAFHPRFIETYKDRVFAAGYSGALSSVNFSAAGEFEDWNPEDSFEVRTNDGDYITGLKAYKQSLYIFKQNSFHAYTGDNINNSVLQELNVEYGCVNHWSIARYNNQLAFLDRKGLMSWNGSGLEFLSEKVQPFFDRMNYQAALNEATVVHDKLRSQLVVSIPVDGATLNNMNLVYNYMTRGWHREEGWNPSIVATVQGRNQTKNLMYGSYSGVINWFGPSFLTDNGAGITCYVKPRWLHDIGDSYTKQFRRLYVNIDKPGSTMTFYLNFYRDYGPSIVLSTTMYLGEFQNRIDFGIAGKAVAFEMASINTNAALKIYGFTLESRLQRQV